MYFVLTEADSRRYVNIGFNSKCSALSLFKMVWKKYILWFAQEHVDFRFPASMHTLNGWIDSYLENRFILGVAVTAVHVQYSTPTVSNKYRGGRTMIVYLVAFH